jgi:hypothetical protein
MRHSWSFLLLATLGASSLPAQETVTRTVRADGAASIRVFNLAGTTHIVGWNSDSIRVTATVPRDGGRFFMGGSVTAFKMGVEAKEQGAEIPPSTLEIRVPRLARIWVKSATAGISVENAGGELDLASVSGRITVTGSPRVVMAESMDGAIVISADAPVMRIKSADGAITIRHAGGDLTISSVSGAINVTSARELISGRIESVTGRVTFEGAVSPDGALDLQTHEAPITIVLPATQSATLDITAFSGKVMSGFPGARRTASPGQPVRYTLGSGSARISVRSLKGGVRVQQLDIKGDSNAP